MPIGAHDQQPGAFLLGVIQQRPARRFSNALQLKSPTSAAAIVRFGSAVGWPSSFM
jgi:hypothetical protein